MGLIDDIKNDLMKPIDDIKNKMEGPINDIIIFFRDTLPQMILQLTNIEINTNCAMKSFVNYKKCLLNYVLDMIFLEITIVLALLALFTKNATVIILTIIFAVITSWSMTNPHNAVKNYILYPLDKTRIFIINTYNQAKYDFLVGYNIIIAIMNDAIFSKSKDKCVHKPQKNHNNKHPSKEGLTELNSSSKSQISTEFAQSKTQISTEFAQSKSQISTGGFDGDFLGIAGYFKPIDNPIQRILAIPDDAYFIRTDDDIDKCYCFTVVKAYFNPLTDDPKYDIGGRITGDIIFIYIYISQLLEDLLFGKKCKRRN